MVRIPWRRKAPRPAQQQDSQPDLESWADRDGKIEVSQPKGFFTKVSLRARVDLPPDDVYDILIDPDNSAVFKGIKEVKYRKVLNDDKKGRQKVEVEQLAAWKFLMFSGSFATRLYVFQDKQQRTVDFKLARPGLMKDFAGKWTVQPFTQNTLNGIYSKAEQPANAAPWHSLTSSLTRRMGDSKAEASLVTLEQSLEPNFRPPKPFDGLVKGIAAQQLKNILDQLRGEVPRIKAGKPSLPSWRVRNGSAPQALLAGNGRRQDIEQTTSHNSKHIVEAASQEERPVFQQVPLACIGDSVITLPEVPRVPPGEMHCHHVEQPGHSWDEWPTNSLWGAIAGSKKQRKQVMWFDAVVDYHQNQFGRAQQVRPQRRT